MTAPNLLFIYTDEQAFNTLAAYGNPQIQMPNLNRLAGESFVFDQAYVTQPVCTPSRASLLTGLYPHTTGCTQNNVPLRPETRCLAEMLTPGTYVTGHFGKWHLGDELFAQHGFDEWVSIEEMYNEFFSEGLDRSTHSSYHGFLLENNLTPKNGRSFGRGEAARLPESLGKPAFLARRASEFLRASRGRPFALYVNFLEPHMPFFGPRDGQHPVDTIPLPGNFTHELSDHQPIKARLLREHYFRHGHSGMPLRTEADWRRMIANYWGLCSLVDTYVGVILDCLDECGLRENTIVVFTSDHGDMMGAHRLLAKCVMFQEAVRVPLLLRLPGQERGRRVTGPVSQVDLVPTLLDLMGQEIPEELEGKSLRSVLGSDRPVVHGGAFIEWNGANSGLGAAAPGRSIPDWAETIARPEEIRAAMSDPVRSVVSDDGWKLNCSAIEEHELYDLENDPFETRNLFAREKGRAAELRARIALWQDRTRDPVTLSRF